MSGGRFFSATSKIYPYGKYSHDGGNVGETQYQDQQPGNIPDWSQKYVYYVGQEIFAPNNLYYRCVVNHIADDVFANDLALVYWVPISAPATVTGMRNGLSLVATFGELGGALIHATDIELAGFDFTISNGTINAVSFLNRELRDNTGTPTFNWQTKEIIGTSWKYLDGNQANGYLMVSDVAGNMTWTNPSTVVGALAWLQDGNTNGALKYIGTNDAFDFPIYTGGIERARFLSTNGDLGLGTTTPNAKLQIFSGGLIVGSTAVALAHTAGFGQALTSSVIGFKNGFNVNVTSNWLWDLNNNNDTGLFRLWNSGTILASVSADAGGLVRRADFKIDGGVDNFYINAGTGVLTHLSDSIFGAAISPTARVHIRGIDNTLANYAFLVEDSLGASLFSIRDDGQLLFNGGPLSAIYGGTGLTTFGGTNHVLFTTTANNISSSANFAYNGTALQIGAPTSPTSERRLTLLQGTAYLYAGGMVTATSEAGIWMFSTNTTPTDANVRFASSGTSTIVNNTGTGGSLLFQINGTTRYTLDNTSISYNPAAATAGNTTVFDYATPASTTQTASTEAIGFRVNMNAAIGHATGALVLQRDAQFIARTHTFVGASTVTDLVTLAIRSAPIAGNNCNATNVHGLFIQSDDVSIGTGTVTNSYAATFNAMTGATNNYAAQFLGGITKLTGGITVGTGGDITDILIATATLDFPNTSAGANSDLTVTVTGAALNDQVLIGVPNGSVSATDNVVFWAWVSAANTVTIRFNNCNLLAAVNPASGSFKVTVLKTA